LFRKSFGRVCRKPSQSLMVCLFGDYDPHYPREVIISRGLAKNGVAVVECNCRIKASRGQQKLKVLYILRVYFMLIIKFYLLARKSTHLLVPHNNHLVVPLAWLLSRLHKKKLIVDAFDPAYRTALMKGLSPLQARIRYYLEKVALVLPNCVLVTTDEFKKLYLEDYKIQSSKIFVVPAGADQKTFRRQEGATKKSEPFTVLYWGNFHPHHGVEIILEAAKILKKYSDIRFILAGSSDKLGQYKKMAENMALNNVEFPGFLPDSDLVSLIARADICLGVFSNHRLALCSITNKVFQALAMGKVVVTERSPAVETWFRHKEHLYMIPPENSAALAQAIRILQNDETLRCKIAKKAFEIFQERFSEDAIGKTLLMVLNSLRQKGL